MPSEYSKAVKKEETDDEDEKPIGSLSDRKKKNAKREPTKLKKQDSERLSKATKKQDSDDDKLITVKSSKKKKEKEDGKNKKGGKAATVRKVYDLPGQKRDPPQERDPLRIFYETLYEQVPDSDMAAIWMMESGLLPRDKAIKILERKQKKAEKQKLSSPMKSVVTVTKSGDSVTIMKKQSLTPKSKQKNGTPQTKKTPISIVASQKKKRKIQEDSEEEDSDDEVIAAPKKRKIKE